MGHPFCTQINEISQCMSLDIVLHTKSDTVCDQKCMQFLQSVINALLDSTTSFDPCILEHLKRVGFHLSSEAFLVCSF